MHNGMGDELSGVKVRKWVLTQCMIMCRDVNESCETRDSNFFCIPGNGFLDF